MQSIWLTGSTGFLGFHILKEALRHQNISITALVRVQPVQPMKGVSYLTYDEIWAKSNKLPDIVINAATEYGRGGLSQIPVVEANLLMPLRLFHLTKDSAQTFVTLDSYYNKASQPYPYLQDYCLSKRQLSDWLMLSDRPQNVRRVFLEHLYGPLDREDKFVPQLLSALIQHAPVNLTNGTQTRDFVYVEDAAKGILNLALTPTQSELRVNRHEIGSGTPITLKDFVLRAKTLTKSKSKISFGAIPMREGEILESFADLRSLERTNWRPETDLDKGLLATIAAVKDFTKMRREGR